MEKYNKTPSFSSDFFGTLMSWERMNKNMRALYMLFGYRKGEENMIKVYHEPKLKNK